ncbi:acyl transferase domain-containing protein [Mycena olivaceomarginata]|nr:acyl transferase domain-containing protein [Mycena olivaceomarginata]
MLVAFERAGHSPSEAAYVELHATGTAKGDPTEANWVGQRFRRANELLVGSVKGNIGHTEITAFLASLSKVISIFEHNIIPPNVNLLTPNPAIKWLEYNLRVPTSPTPLPSPESGKPLISMSGSGIGGSNGHVVLEAPPSIVSQHGPVSLERESGGPVLLMAAGLSLRSTSAVAEQLEKLLEIAPPSEYFVASTILGKRAKQMNWRSWAISVPGPGATIQFSAPQHSLREVNPLVFVFSGQGPQHQNMGRELFRVFPIFRRSILDMDEIFQRVTHKSMIHDYGIFGCASSSFEFPSLWPISVTLPAIAMFQIALFDLLVQFGVSPDIVIGHSAGETAVLYASGAAPKAMAVELAIIRGQIFTPLETSEGTMAALSCPPSEAERLLAEHRCANPESIVELACLNSSTAVAISGHEVAIDGVLRLAEQKGILGRKIRTRVPIHSSMMDVCRDQYLTAMRDLFNRFRGPYLPKIATYSTLTGALLRGAFDPDYFWMNTRCQVLFAPAVQNIDKAATFVEIAPHPVLASYLSELAADSATVLSTVRRSKTGATSTENYAILELFGKLTAAGHNCVDFAMLNGIAYSESRISLPPYPFQKRRFPLYPDCMEPRHYGPVNRSHLKLNRDTHPTLSEHVIRGEPIWPASGFLEMALEFGATTLLNVNLRALLPLSAENPIATEIILDGAYWKIQRFHADGYLSFESPPTYDNLNISEIRNRCDCHVDSEFYPSLSYFSSYGPKFQRVTNLYYNSNEALASISGVVGYLERPFNGDFSPNNYYLPSRIGELTLHRPPKAGYFPPHIYAHIQLSKWMPESMSYDVTVVDDLGQRLCTLHNFEVARHQLSPRRTISSPLHIMWQPVHTQKPAWKPNTRQVISLFNEDAFLFNYMLGDEQQLQWDFSGLAPSQELEIWIIASEGADTAAGLGLARALRREYVFWTIRFVSFPSTFGEQLQRQCLQSLPHCLATEPDIIFSPLGEPLVPRLVPLVPPTEVQRKPFELNSLQHTLRPDHIFTHIHRTSIYPDFAAIIASVIQTDLQEYPPGSLVVGLQNNASEGRAVIDAACVTPVDLPVSRTFVDKVPGLVVAFLGPGLSTWKRSRRLGFLRILITHCDTAIGSTISEIYRHEGLEFSQIQQSASMLDLSHMGLERFDLIISGYENRTHVQILRSLCSSTGKLFLWPQELPRFIREDPCSIGDALRLAMSRGFPGTCNSASDPLTFQHAKSDLPLESPPVGAVFDPEKVYVILGGIGSIGAHISLWMAQRGARRIMVTSRSGALIEKTLIVQHLFAYLQGLENLDISLKAVDATSTASMTEFFSSIDAEVGGCIILTAVLADGLFPTLGDSEFASGVIETSSLEFIIAFSSMTSTNYCAANAALEEEMGSLPNGFSFVCPGILDSALMLSDGIAGHEARLKHLTEWSISAEEMLLWLDDAICLYQSGARFQRYIPNVDWEAMDRTLGMTRVGAHLVRSRSQEIPVASESVESQASTIVRSVLNISEDDFDVNMPLTSYGLDSLSASRLSFALRSIMEVTQLQLLADTSLADIIRKIPQLSLNSGGVGISLTKSPVTSLMDQLVAKFKDEMACSQKTTPSRSDSSGHVVLLTGSTGALGSHILAHLLADDRIRLVYALNRKSPGDVPTVERQRAVFNNQGLSQDFAHSTKLKLFEGDISEENFGISSQIMDESRPVPPSMISGPERPITDAKVAVQTGYLESKWVAERLVQIAAERGDLNVNVIRVGLLTGGINGSWDTSHWFPALVQSGVLIGCLPDGCDRISWIPINDAAAAIVDMHTCINETLHLVHPRSTTWNAVIEPLASNLGVPLVPYAEWFARLKNAAETAPRQHRTQNMAALKLLDFFRLGLKPAANTGKHGAVAEGRCRQGNSCLGNTDARGSFTSWFG